MIKKISKTKLHVIGWFICSLGALFYCYEYLLRIEPSIMISELMEHFRVSATGLSLVIASYYYAYTPMQFSVGILIDRYGTKKMIGLGVICCTIGSFLFSIAHVVFLAAIARFLIGFGSSFAFVGVLKLGAEWLPEERFALFTGITTSLGMLGGMIGDIFLMSLLKEMGWVNILHISTFLGLLLTPLILLFVHDTPAAKIGKITLNRSFPHIITELKKILKHPQIWLSGLIASSLYLSLTAFAELWGVKFLQTVYKIPAMQASFAVSMVFLGWLVGSPINGWLSDHINSRKKPLLFGLSLSFLCITLIIIKPFPMPYILLCILLFLFGLFSSTQVICFAISKENSSLSVAATTLALTNFLVMLSGIIFQPLIGILLDLNWQGEIMDNIRVYSARTYQSVFLIIPVCLLLGLFILRKVKETLTED